MLREFAPDFADCIPTLGESTETLGNVLAT